MVAGPPHVPEQEELTVPRAPHPWVQPARPVRSTCLPGPGCAEVVLETASGRHLLCLHL